MEDSTTFGTGFNQYPVNIVYHLCTLKFILPIASQSDRRIPDLRTWQLRPDLLDGGIFGASLFSPGRRLLSTSLASMSSTGFVRLA